MGLRNQKLFFIALVAGILSACSIYKSDGREIIQKNVNGNVRFAVNVELATRYACFAADHRPAIWDDTSTPLREYTSTDMVDAKLTQNEEMPVVLVQLTETNEANFEGCTLQILDSKLSSQRLKDVVAFGEKLLLEKESAENKDATGRLFQ